MSEAAARALRRSATADRAHLASLPKGTARRILRTARPYRAALVVFIAVVIAGAVITAVGPLLLRRLIDDGIVARDRSVVIPVAVTIGVLAVGEAFLTLFQRWLSARIGEGLIYDLRSQVFRHVQRQPLAFFVRTQTGSLVTRLNSDIIGAQRTFTDLLSNVVGNLFVVALVLAGMVSLSPQLTLLALVALPVFGLPARYIGRHLARVTRERMDHNAAMGTMMAERFNVSGAQLSKLYADPEAEAAEFDARAGRVRDIGVYIALYGRSFAVALTLVAAVATASVYGFGGTLAAEGSIEVGTVVALVAYLGRLYGPITSLSGAHVDVATTLVSFQRVFEVLDLEPLIAERPDAVDQPRGPATLSFEHVGFTYPSADEVSVASLEAVTTLERTTEAPVLQDVSFTVRPGELVALVGPSGAGKTTISSLVPRFYDAGEGHVRLDGVDVRDLTFATIRRRVGVVTQDVHLFHDTLRSNLAMARPGASDDDLRRALEHAQIGHLLDALPHGLDTVVGDRGHRLSGGEKQRVALARILLKEPDVVVLDEATAHLDAESEAAVQQALDTALAGRTSLVIAHRLSTVRRADQIVVIDRGRVVQRGTHAELLAAGGLYADLHRRQFDGGDPLGTDGATDRLAIPTGDPAVGADSPLTRS